MNKKKKNVIQLIKNVYNKLCVIKILLNVYINNAIKNTPINIASVIQNALIPNEGLHIKTMFTANSRSINNTEHILPPVVIFPPTK